MPVLNGLDASREIRSVLRADLQPYIAALTANSMQEDKDRCIAAGMAEFLSKPVGEPLSSVVFLFC